MALEFSNMFIISDPSQSQGNSLGWNYDGRIVAKEPIGDSLLSCLTEIYASPVGSLRYKLYRRVSNAFPVASDSQGKAQAAKVGTATMKFKGSKGGKLL